jgi:hypothetical protein
VLLGGVRLSQERQAGRNSIPEARRGCRSSVTPESAVARVFNRRDGHIPRSPTQRTGW